MPIPKQYSGHMQIPLYKPLIYITQEAGTTQKPGNSFYIFKNYVAIARHRYVAEIGIRYQPIDVHRKNWMSPMNDKCGSRIYFHEIMKILKNNDELFLIWGYHNVRQQIVAPSLPRDGF